MSAQVDNDFRTTPEFQEIQLIAANMSDELGRMLALLDRLDPAPAANQSRSSRPEAGSASPVSTQAGEDGRAGQGPSALPMPAS
ncbi:hypothetical protein [Methyloceanibacter caenitepidi]|uniref:Uncharacterized protein n=1 Tax=Methyloceanibacter caenitepidi TaxID=1384459 RepID=A0A0A8K4M8_9HYPH|nr:hypothetical protein [Methyloceanibacter caenitepidi]BAQ16954.1 hypothetical protein GL4_1498 [Methyloceanibacter caenitepidi]